jgi:hypothetical protein
MIDTIKISTEKFEIGNYDMFIAYKKIDNKLYRTNKTLKELMEEEHKKNEKIYACLKKSDNNVYKPRVKYICSYYTNPKLYIEFSIPKLLFGNNLTELKEKDYVNVVNKLINTLKDLKIIVTENAINNALVRRVDFSKNLFLKEDLTCEDVVSLLSKVTYPRMKLDIIKEGKWIKFHNKSIAILFYDKKEEFKENNVKLPQYIQTICEKDIPIFRIEIQIKGKNIIDSIARHNNIRRMSFKDIFNENNFKYIFDKYLIKLHKCIPDTVIDEEDLKSLYCNQRGILLKKKAILHTQEKYNNYNDAIKEIIKDYGKHFLKAHNCILIKKDGLKFILLKFLEEIKDYNPFFNSS